MAEDFTFTFQKVTIAEAADVLRGSVAGRDYSGERMPLQPHQLVLSEAAKAWMQSLPEQVRPSELAIAYPRIINRIVATWPYPHELPGLMNEYLMDARGTRKGFAAGVAKDLSVLQDYIAAVVVKKGAGARPDIWQDREKQ